MPVAAIQEAPAPSPLSHSESGRHPSRKSVSRSFSGRIAAPQLPPTAGCHTMTIDRARQVTQNFDSPLRHSYPASPSERPCAGSPDATASGGRPDPVVLPAWASLPFDLDAANDPSGDFDHMVEEIRGRWWRPIWCNGYRYLATRDLATYPPTAEGFRRAIRVLTPLIQSLVDDPDHRPDARSSSTDRSLSYRDADMRVQVVPVRRARPNPATLARWVREHRTR